MGTGQRNQEAHVPDTTTGTAGTTSRAASAPRTLAEALRVRTDDSLAALLRTRPDLLSPGARRPHPARHPGRAPGPPSSAPWNGSTRSPSRPPRPSPSRPTRPRTRRVRSLLAGDDGDPDVEDALPGAVAALREQALVWGGDDRLRLRAHRP